MEGRVSGSGGMQVGRRRSVHVQLVTKAEAQRDILNVCARAVEQPLFPVQQVSTHLTKLVHYSIFGILAALNCLCKRIKLAVNCDDIWAKVFLRFVAALTKVAHNNKFKVALVKYADLD